DLLRAGSGGGADLDHVLDDARHPGPERARPVALDDVVGALLGDEETDIGGDGSGDGHVGRLRMRISRPFDRGVAGRAVLGRTPADRAGRGCAESATRAGRCEAPGGRSGGFAYAGRRTAFEPLTQKM